MPEETKDAIRDCLDCYKACTATFTHCLEKGGEHAAPGHLRILWDCAELCQITATFLLRQSDWAKRISENCADACSRCAEDCSEFPEDKMMQQCADVCRKCALACREAARA